MNKVELSIIIPVHNAQNYIKRQVDSILKINSVKYELILVENNSTDNTLQILNNIKNENIKVYTIEANSIGESLNYGLSKAQGNAVYICDADDEVLAQSLIQAYKRLMSSPRYDIVSCKYVVYNQQNIINIAPNKKEFTNAYWNKIYKREFINKYKIKFEEKINVQDGCFNTDIINKIPKVIYVDNIIYKYYIGVDSISDKVKEKTLNGFIISNKKQQESIKKSIRTTKQLEIHKYYRFLVGEVYKSIFTKYVNLAKKEVFLMPNYIGNKKKGLSYVVYVILLNNSYNEFKVLQKEYKKFLLKVGYQNQRQFLFDKKSNTKKYKIKYFYFLMKMSLKSKKHRKIYLSIIKEIIKK